MQRSRPLLIACILSAVPLAAVAQEDEVQRTIRLNEGIEQLAPGGDVAQAERTFQALVAAPNVPPEQMRIYRYYLAIAQLRQRSYDQAAANLDQALRGLEPGTPEYKTFASAHLDRGLALLMSEQEDQAVRSLKEFVDRQPTDAGRMLLGIAEYRTEHYDDAVGTLEPLTGRDGSPYQSYALYYTGLAQAWVGQREDAKSSLRRLSRLEQLPTELGQQANTILQKLETVEVEEVSPFNWRFTLEAGNVYDTNVILLGNRTKPVQPVDNKDDYRFGLMADLNLDYQPQEGPLEDWHFNIGATIYESWHPSIQEFNVQDYATTVYVGRKLYDDETTFINFAEIGLRYDYDYSLVGNNGFLSRNGLAAVGYLEEANGVARTYVEVGDQIRDYQEDLFSNAFDRDGNYWSATVVQELDVYEVPEAWRYSFAPDAPRYVTGRLGYRHDNNSTQGDEFDFDANTVSAGVDVPLPWNLEFDFSSEFEWQNYWQRSLIDYDRSGRDDFIQRYVFRLGRRFNEWFELYGEIAWTIDDSNVKSRLGEEVFSYDRVIYGITARLTFPQ